MRRLTATCLVTTTLAACVAQTTPGQVAHPFEGVTIQLASRIVEVQAWACRDSGAVMQIACAANTREDESILVIAPQPSEIRAALRMAGFAEGSPGRWVRQNGTSRFIPPTGAPVDICARWEPVPGQSVEVPIGNWVRYADARPTLPGSTWIFGGSHLAATPAWAGGEAHLEADLTGSVIGLATFGDEVLGYPQGFADPAAGDPAAWSIRAQDVPTIGTPVTLLLRPAAGGG